MQDELEIDEDMVDEAPEQSVRRRRVFYIPGYDPIHPRRYRELYRTESALQGQISGYDISIAPKSGRNYGWQVESEVDGQVTHTEIDVLVWSDIVRKSMASTIPATYLQLVQTAWTYIASGALRRLMWLRKGPVIAALYPVGMLLLQLILAVVAGYVAARLLGLGLTAAFDGVASLFNRLFPPDPGDPAFDTTILLVARSVLQWALAGGVAWQVLRWFKKKDGKFFAYYLMHDYAYSARWKGANPPELEERMAQFREEIAHALRGPVDEVLVVGHSSGAHLAVSILADLIRKGDAPLGGPALSFLSLGQVVPMVSFLPEASRLRADLHYLSSREELFWMDVTAPGDGCAFALCDPVAVSGVSPEGQRWPLVVSAAFTQTLAPETWKKLRWRFFRLHFQYLCSFDRPGDYDYFLITGGPMALGHRYEFRQPSKSRIDVPASKYTSMAHDDTAQAAVPA